MHTYTPIAIGRMFRNRRRIAAAAAIGAAAVALTVAVAPSQATYPGKNGRIAFRRYFDNDHRLSAIFTINVDGSGEQRVTHAPKGFVDDQPDWSPDGSLVVFSRCVPEGLCAVYTVHADGSHLKRLSPPCPGGKGPPKCEDDANVSFLPDGKHVVFTRTSGKANRTQKNQHSDLVVSDLKGEHRRVVLGSKPYQAEYNYAAYSPDGRRFVYEHANSLLAKPRLRHALFVATSNGEADHRIIAWALDAGDNPDWSPDGKWIVFRTHIESDTNSNIAIVHPDGTGLRLLTHFTSAVNMRSASFSPDGEWIVFATDRAQGGNPAVYVMRIDGSELQEVSHSKRWDSAADWGTAG
jgi:TolB protein